MPLEETQEQQQSAGDEQQQQQPAGALADERAAGTPLTDWKDAIQNPKLRDTAGKYTSLDAMIESYNHLGGKLKNAIFLPGDKSTDEDRAKFRKSLGVPDSIEGYTVTPPEGQQYDEGDQAVIEDFAEIALQHNVPAKAFEAFMQKLSGRAQELRQNVVEEIEDARDVAEETLAKEWAGEFDKNVQLATRAAKAHGGDDFIKFLNGTKLEGFGLLGDHPVMVRFLANIGSKSDEHDMVLHSSASERQSAQDEINELMEKNPVGSDGYKSDRVQKRLSQLYAKVHGDQPIVGAPRR